MSQVRERPASLGEVVQPLQEQKGQKSCPDLDAQSVLAGTDEGLDLQVLFQGLEEQLDLPAFPVDPRDRAGRQR